MSQIPSMDEHADALRACEMQQQQQSEHSAQQRGSSDEEGDYYDDEDAEQPSDQQMLEEIGLLFHQSTPALHGAATALNAVLQGPYFDEHSLMTLTGGMESDAYTMNMALQSFGLTLEPAKSRRSTQPLQSENAFLCFHEQRWYALRRFGVHWMHFKDTLDRPHNIEQVELCLSQLQSDGCEVYVVRGKLPACAGDERSFWHVPFSWESLMRNSGMYDCTNGACGEVGHCMCVGDEAVFDLRFEEDLRAAIAASLEDVGGGNGAIRIKRDVSSGMGTNGEGGEGSHGGEKPSRL